MIILDLDCLNVISNILLNLKNNNIFVIKYLIRILSKDIKGYRRPKINNNNIVEESYKNIKYKMQGLLFKITYENNIINIFTINRNKESNNVLYIKIYEYYAEITKLNKYKKYNKINILNIGTKIISYYKNIKKIIILNECLYDNFYKNISNFYNHRSLSFFPYLINEPFIDKLNRLIKFKYDIYLKVKKLDNLDFYLMFYHKDFDKDEKVYYKIKSITNYDNIQVYCKSYDCSHIYVYDNKMI